VRAQLHGQVDLHDRLVTGNHFAHNKFVVFCGADGTPQKVLTGSTNWTMTGLCTQANNAVVVEDAGLAADFLDQWHQLVAAQNDYPASLATSNSTSHAYNVDGGTITQWFAPTSGGEDLEYARGLINAAKDGILFLFFNPGAFVPDGQPPVKWTLLQNILFRHRPQGPAYDASLYIRGVVNQEIANLTTVAPTPASPNPTAVVPDPASPAPVTLYTGGNTAATPVNHDAMVPANVKAAFHDWAAESLGTGVHVHSKVVVLDPFGQKPVVMTGSHNLGYKASTENDDNLIIIEGNAPLAQAYALNIISIFDSYRWNTYVEAHSQDANVWHGLVDSDSWQDSYLTGASLAELEFWMGADPPAG
jgi:phosphatidylserine/phosphatidylglycerophosphate/cardiolipin synthase-like enzyme